MMMQEVVTLNDTLLTMNLAEMITEVDVEKQCAKTASWNISLCKGLCFH
jgi:hypothetical protein